MKKGQIRAALLGLGGLAALVYGCKPTEIGFISDQIYYRVNPFIATQGVTSYSAPLELDGSTAPLSVKLVAVRNKITDASADILLKSFNIPQYTGAITRDDSTLELLNKKLVIKPQQVFQINPLGGRIELSAATDSIPTGTYTFDLEVENLRGKRLLKNACDIQVVNSTKPVFTLKDGSFYSTSDATAETNFTPSNPMPVTVKRIENGKNLIILKYVDKNGVPFNPANGEIVIRGDRGNFAQMNPYFKVIKTDTAMVWQFPLLPIGFPAFGGNNGDLIYYRIPARFTPINRNVNVTMAGLKVYAAGTYVFTMQVPTITRKP